MGDLVKTPFSRLFTIEDRAGPTNVPVYQGQAKAGAPAADFGDVTAVRNPSGTRYGGFDVVDTIRGEPALPTLPLMVRYQYTIDEFLRMGNRGCPLDVQLHMDPCADPRDFNRGWVSGKVLVLEGGIITGWNPDDMGALEQGESAVINASVDIPGRKLYEIVPLSMAELAAAEITGEVIDVAICDSIQCGQCGIPSTGCQVVFAITEQQVDSPGLPGEIVFSQDGGLTIGETNVATLPPNFDAAAMICVGTRLVVVSNDDCAIHYALTIDVLNGVEVWTRTDAGLICAAGAPNDLFSLGSAHTWLVGDAGYIYFTDDITGAVTVQDAGIAAGANNLNAVHAYDEDNVGVVGAASACAVTRNGGATWVNVDTTALGVLELTCVWMRSRDVWMVGTGQGNLWFTIDGGVNWTEKAFPGVGEGGVRDIVFATPTGGYMAHDTDAVAGRILRTIDGGNSWYVLPEGPGAIPANDRINALAAVEECPNVVYGGGLAAAGAGDGFFVKGAA